MRTDALHYDLPSRLIAVKPVHPRDAARMMVVRRSGDCVEHARVSDLPRYLRAPDVLIVNDTAVAPARFRGRRADSGGKVEGLFLLEASPGAWRVMLKCNGRLRPGVEIVLVRPGAETESRHRLILRRREDALWEVGLTSGQGTQEVLDEIGLTPLPPYILRARGGNVVADQSDRVWYQTVYADMAKRDSVAAPTAGLHFTGALLARLDQALIRRLSVTLHVGVGTFQPVTVDRLEDHRMHEESFAVSRSVLETIRSIRAESGRAVAIGTTTIRALESVPCSVLGRADQPDIVRGSTDLMIRPPYEFRWIDGLLTNFHLPRSTLLAMVGAFVGLERVLDLYRIAVAEEYRFYSYGDCMLILP